MSPGDRVGGRFRIVAQLASGPMGQVYHAKDDPPRDPSPYLTWEGGREVLLKVSTTAPRAIRRARSEGRVLKALAASEAFPKVVAEGELAAGKDGQPAVYLALAWIHGEDLASLRARRPLTAAEAMALVAQAARAVEAAHAIGVVHRDLSPRNLLVDPEGRLHVLDLGAARLLAEPDEERGSLIGTPEYMAPEQARPDGEISAAADVYALGAVLFDLLTGRPPITGESTLEVLGRLGVERPPLLCSLRRDLPEALERLVARALSTRAPERPSARELGDALDRIKLESTLIEVPLTPSRDLPATVDLPSTGERRMIVVLAAALPEGVQLSSAAVSALCAAVGTSATVRIEPDTFYAAFGAARTQRDETLRAARVALDSARAQPRLRVGLAAGFGDQAEPFEGEAAARARGALRGSAPGRIRIDTDAAGLFGSDLEIERGQDGLWLLGETEGSLAPPRLASGTELFVGRSRELEIATSIVLKSFEKNTAPVLWLRGPDGSGKSRLRTELWGRLWAGEETQSLALRCESANAHHPFGALAQALRRFARLPPSAGSGERVRRSRECFGAGLEGAEAEDVAALVAELAEIHLPESTSPKLVVARESSRDRRGLLAAAFVRFLEAQASRGAFGISVDDVRHLDPETFSLFDDAFRLLANRPIAWVLVGRSDAGRAFPPNFASSVTTVDVDRLDAGEAEAFVRAALEGADDDNVRALVDRASGNPLVLRELVRAAALRAHSPHRADSLPPAVHALAQAKLDRFSAPVRIVARAASVFHGVFFPDALRSMLPGLDIDGALVELLRGEMIVRLPERDRGESHAFAFVAPIDRDAALRMLPPEERAELEAAARAWLTEGAAR